MLKEKKRGVVRSRKVRSRKARTHAELPQEVGDMKERFGRYDPSHSH